MSATTEKKTIRIWFADSGDPYVRDMIQDILGQRYDLVLDDEHPEFLFFSIFGYEHLKYGEDCIKVMYSGENVFPNFNEFDYAVSSSCLEYVDRHLYIPPCCYHDTKEEKNMPLEEVEESMAHRRFCCFLYKVMNHDRGAFLRAELCKMLTAKYKKVDCPGVALHNMDAPELADRFADDWSVSKIKFLTKYKFNIAFENSNSPGYVTEKLSDSFKANTVPIYWGSEGTQLPKDAMIYANDYPDLESLVQRIIEVDNNDEEYMKILRANPLRKGMDFNRRRELSDFLYNIIEHGTKLPHGFNTLYQGDGAFKILYTTPRGKRRILTRLFLKVLQITTSLKAIMRIGRREDLERDKLHIGGICFRDKRAGS